MVCHPGPDAIAQSSSCTSAMHTIFVQCSPDGRHTNNNNRGAWMSPLAAYSGLFWDLESINLPLGGIFVAQLLVERVNDIEFVWMCVGEVETVKGLVFSLFHPDGLKTPDFSFTFKSVIHPFLIPRKRGRVTAWTRLQSSTGLHRDKWDKQLNTLTPTVNLVFLLWGDIANHSLTGFFLMYFKTLRFFLLVFTQKKNLKGVQNLYHMYNLYNVIYFATHNHSLN